MDELLSKFDFEKINKFFLIFDIDGTLRPDTVMALDHRYPKIDPRTAQQLKQLNTHPKFRVAILTARSYVDIFRSNISNNIIKFCGFGKQIVNNDILRYAREDFSRAYDETVMFVDIIKDIIGPILASELDFLLTPGDFSLYFEAEDYQEKKEKILEILQLILFNSRRWQMIDMGKELIFKDRKYPYDKGDAIFDILDAMDLNNLTQVLFFGDSQADYRAMIALREYQKLHPQKRLKVTNIAVGPALLGQELVTYNFESYKDTTQFVDHLYRLTYEKF